MMPKPPGSSNGPGNGWREKLSAFFVDGPYGKIVAVAVIVLGGAIAVAVRDEDGPDRFGIRADTPAATVAAVDGALKLTADFAHPVHALVFGRDAANGPVVVMPSDQSGLARGLASGSTTLTLGQSAAPWTLIVCRRPFRERDALNRDTMTIVTPPGCTATQIQDVGSASSGVEGSK
ncbi:MAG: hypothetical protein ACI9MR_000092 [Myxococcota bacterium]|jgi:hypothetical protein